MIFINGLDLPVVQSELFVDIRVVVVYGLGVTQNERMQKLNEHELSLVQRQKSQCNAIHNRREKHSED